MRRTPEPVTRSFAPGAGVAVDPAPGVTHYGTVTARQGRAHGPVHRISGVPGSWWPTDALRAAERPVW